jgi:hypothetical protein
MEQKFRDKVNEYRFRNKSSSQRTLQAIIPKLVDRRSFDCYYYYTSHIVPYDKHVMYSCCDYCSRMDPAFVVKMDHKINSLFVGDSWWSYVSLCFVCDQQRLLQQFLHYSKRSMSKFSTVIGKYLATKGFPAMCLLDVQITQPVYFYDNCYICQGIKYFYTGKKCAMCPNPANLVKIRHKLGGEKKPSLWTEQLLCNECMEEVIDDCS